MILPLRKIKHVFTDNSAISKCALAEVTIKHIKTHLGRALVTDRRNVLDKIKNIVFAMNNSTHSHIRPSFVSSSDLLIEPENRTRPNAPTQSCAELIALTNLHYRRYQHDRSANALVKGTVPKFTVGDWVRICIEPTKFSKPSDQTWSSESYKIIKVMPTIPLYSYRLGVKTPDNVIILLNGNFSEIKLRADRSEK